MIHDVLRFLTGQLNAYLDASLGQSPVEPAQEKVVLPDGEKMDPITFQLGSVSALVINLEQEKLLRPADRYRRSLPDGTTLDAQPEIRMSLYLLFVARFKDYGQAWRHLSAIIRFFQSRRVFDHHNAPALTEGIEKLILELVTLPFPDQNEVWNALRTTYHPSVLYKVSLVVFRGEEGLAAPVIDDLQGKAVPK